MSRTPDPFPRLYRIAATSIAVGIGVLALKLLAWWITGSVALLSDALESTVNVATAVTTVLALRYAARPVDRNHPYGHHKAELLSAALEGVLIVAAALVILHQALAGLRLPPEIAAGPLGLGLNAAATALNAIWGLYLMHEGRRLVSPALTADGHHLMSDVVSSVGVLFGTAAALVTGWAILDPITAAVVALHVLATGLRVLWSAGRELMDEAPPPETMQALHAAIARTATGATEAHDLRARTAGRSVFAEFHLVVPAGMTVEAAHRICDRIEAEVARVLPHCLLSIHVEPACGSASVPPPADGPLLRIVL
ncbi:MAG: cation diffusion facilitator family transporter [Rhodobacteraceae bacterium]|jgi:cation diffusion facilitator family transporter|nr:cation diffusion facilitator family transporter [Paracoccaceae bacterium]